MATVILQNTYIEIKASDTRVELKLSGSIPSEVFRQACNTIQVYLQENQVSEWLVDQHTMSVHPKDYQWFFEEYLQNQGLFNEASYIAIVMSKNFYCKFTLNQYLKTFFPNGTLNIARFDSKADATAWLSEVNQVFDFDNFI